MYTLIILAGLAYIVYHAFKAGKRIGSQKGFAAGDSAVAHVDFPSHSIARPPASELIG